MLSFGIWPRVIVGPGFSGVGLGSGLKIAGLWIGLGLGLGYIRHTVWDRNWKLG